MSSPYAARRKRVREAICPGILVVPAALPATRNNDVLHEYRQASDFYYLTGFEEPGAILLLSSESEAPFVMFVRPRDDTREQWDGPVVGIEGAKAEFGADAAFGIDEFDSRIEELLDGHERLYVSLGDQPELDRRLIEVVAGMRRRARLGKLWPTQWLDPREVVHEQRLVKEPVEVELLRKSASIACAGHRRAMEYAQPGMLECDLETELYAAFRRGGAARLAYPSIVGSGANATTLHYIRNDRVMQPGDLVLIDAGCEYGYYASDITRTFPVSGRFSVEQRSIYEIVLSAQLEAIAAVRPGATLEDIHQVAVQALADGLAALRWPGLPSSRAEWLESGALRRFYMHRTSHWLGMDVHDVGSYGRPGAHRELEPGMVLTVEPGLYLRAADDFPAAFHGIGVRIEDDVLVTEHGGEVLTRDAPKEIAQIEASCQG